MAEKQNNVTRRLPVRRCAGCGEHFPKNQLIRVLRTPEGEIVLDLTGKRSGRGAYLCKDARCFKRARKTKRIDSSLDVTVPEEVYDRMEEEISRAEA